MQMQSELREALLRHAPTWDNDIQSQSAQFYRQDWATWFIQSMGLHFNLYTRKKNWAEVKYGCSRSHRWLDFLSLCCVADTAERQWGFCVCLQLVVQKAVSPVSKRIKIIQAEDRLWFRQDAWKLAGAELIISHLCILLSGKVLPLF